MVFRREPAGIFQLSVIQDNFTPRIGGCETEHEGMGKRPRLVAEIADIFDANPGFFAHFPDEGFFQRFPRVHETGKDAVDAGGKMAGSGPATPDGHAPPER